MRRKKISAPNGGESVYAFLLREELQEVEAALARARALDATNEDAELVRKLAAVARGAAVEVDTKTARRLRLLAVVERLQERISSGDASALTELADATRDGPEGAQRSRGAGGEADDALPRDRFIPLDTAALEQERSDAINAPAKLDAKTVRDVELDAEFLVNDPYGRRSPARRVAYLDLRGDGFPAHEAKKLVRVITAEIEKSRKAR